MSAKKQMQDRHRTGETSGVVAGRPGSYSVVRLGSRLFVRYNSRSGPRLVEVNRAAVSKALRRGRAAIGAGIAPEVNGEGGGN